MQADVVLERELEGVVGQLAGLAGVAGVHRQLCPEQSEPGHVEGRIGPPQLLDHALGRGLRLLRAVEGHLELRREQITAELRTDGGAAAARLEPDEGRFHGRPRAALPRRSRSRRSR